MSISSSNYFEILSHPVRFAILKTLDINMRNFGEILKEVSEEIDIGSSKLNFHLKKLVDLGIIDKSEKIYSVSNLGIKLLSLIQNFEYLEQEGFVEDISQSKQNINASSYINADDDELESTQEIFDPSLENLHLKDANLPLIKRTDDLPLLISVFEYFEGKNYEYMEEHYTLFFPDPISLDLTPQDWIKRFSKNFYPLLKHEKSRQWLEDRLLKLGYGTRGLQDYGLMDASISVPPLINLFETIKELLTTRGKAGLYAKTGMGKSRIALYIASFWMRSFKTPILYLQNPNFITDETIQNLQKVLQSNIKGERTAPKWLVIIEDAHLGNKQQVENIIKLIAGASSKTYAIFVSFTEIPLITDASQTTKFVNEQIDSLKNELIPMEYQSSLNLNQHWKKLRPYFKEWLKWVAADVLIDYLPETNFRDNLDIFQSPWSFVVSLGFLKNSLKNLESASSNNNFPVILYYSIAEIYIMRGERSIPLSALLEMLKNYFNDELTELFGTEWKTKLIQILNTWTLPATRLLPPLKYVQNHKTLSKEALISFYHLHWANEVCTYLEINNSTNKINFNELFIHLFPFMKEIWLKTRESDTELFTQWLRLHVGFDINDVGELRLSKFNFKSDQLLPLKSFKLSEEDIKKLTQSQLVNWLFVKSIISG